jgi:hypothetical protein
MIKLLLDSVVPVRNYLIVSDKTTKRPAVDRHVNMMAPKRSLFGFIKFIIWVDVGRKDWYNSLVNGRKCY